MTVSYNIVVSNSSAWSLVKLLLIVRWRGSIWKAVWLEMLVWLGMFLCINCVFRFVLTEQEKQIFAMLADNLETKLSYIPLNFMLGFFVANVVERWGTILKNIGLIDNVALVTKAHVQGTSEETRLLRRCIVRYCVLSQCLVFRDISMQVRKRFPTLDAVVQGRFMQPHERLRYESVSVEPFAKYWLPVSWAMEHVNRARKCGAIDADVRASSLIMEIKEFRTQLETLSCYDWVPLPIAYPQLVFIAVHIYFFAALFSRQSVHDSELDTIIPFMSCAQFVFYMGWLKVAESLLNPLGEDDDDYECNWLLDRNLRIGLAIVDDAYDTTPEMIQDDFWNTNETQPLYSPASRPVNPLVGSTSSYIEPVERPSTAAWEHLVAIARRPTKGANELAPHLSPHKV